MKEKQHITLQEIASKSGVSISTVSHIINNTRFVKQETREQVEKVMKEMNYNKPVNISKKNKYIGLIVADITEDYSISIIKAIENQCKLLGYSILVADSQDDIKVEHQNISKMLDNERISGILISPVDSQNCDKKLKNSSIPVVCLDRRYDDANFVFFGINNLQTGYKAAQYLDKNNCSNIGFVGYPKQVYSVHQRESGYRIFWQEVHAEKLPNVLKIQYFQKDSVEKIAEFIETKKLDGVICATSGVCHDVLLAVEKLNLNIPKDVKVVSYDDNRWLNFVKYPISVITQPIKEIGIGSVNKVVQLIEKPESALQETSEVYFETGFIDRLNK
jgi:LacI family transcriptional regulator